MFKRPRNPTKIQHADEVSPATWRRARPKSNKSNAREIQQFQREEKVRSVCAGLNPGQGRFLDLCRAGPSELRRLAADRRTHNPLVAGSSRAGPTKKTCRSGHDSVANEDLPLRPNSSDYQQNASELFEGGL
jgi:hypothetical protein